LLASTREQFNIQGEQAIYVARQRQASFEPLARPGHLEPHQLKKRRSRVASGNIRFGDSEPLQVLERQVQAAFAIVRKYILPEIRQLQRRAGVVGELLELGITVAAHI